MKKNSYKLEHSIEQLQTRGYTHFLSMKEYTIIKSRLSSREYSVYYLYDSLNKVLLYKKNIPPISLLRFSNSFMLRHQDIMGVIYGLGIKEEMFGDILSFEGEFYIFVLPSIVSYIKQNVVEIKKKKIQVEEVPLSFSAAFKQEYNRVEILVSSLRIDVVLSSLLHFSRNGILEKFKNKEVTLNYEEEIKATKILRVEDVFSVRKYGKYIYKGILKETKKGGYVIEIWEYK